MKRFLWRGGLVGILLCSASLTCSEAAPAKAGNTSARSTPKAPALTRGNFVSLEMQTSGGFAGIQTRLLISGNHISFSQKRPRSTAADMLQESALSNNQLDALMRLLSEARFTSFFVKYNQPNLNDGFHETVTLKLSDSKNVDRTFVAENYGDRAPAAYYNVTEYLRQLQQEKFVPADKPSSSTSRPADAPNSATTPLVTKENFASIKMSVISPMPPMKDIRLIILGEQAVGQKGLNEPTFQLRCSINGQQPTTTLSYIRGDEYEHLFNVLNGIEYWTIKSDDTYKPPPDFARSTIEIETINNGVTGGMSVTDTGGSAGGRFDALTNEIFKLIQIHEERNRATH